MHVFFSGSAETEVSEALPSEIILEDLLNCNGALKVCEASNEAMEKAMKCWIKGAEEKEAEYETKVANLKFTVQTLAQERVKKILRIYKNFLQF